MEQQRADRSVCLNIEVAVQAVRLRVVFPRTCRFGKAVIGSCASAYSTSLESHGPSTRSSMLVRFEWLARKSVHATSAKFHPNVCRWVSLGKFQVQDMFLIWQLFGSHSGHSKCRDSRFGYACKRVSMAVPSSSCALLVSSRKSFRVSYLLPGGGGGTMATLWQKKSTCSFYNVLA
ncbi:uncharacterized protein M421DRAFT_296274 [Didymella exigua CBS 183.55]|uniref:Uncharacterized protein n=1 Tax=Didymella exigua CBS 183.55 TaxID=1150837 RepID=A0A6A5RC31_9PLEO|nr:uncharacterized protein M421DRAFT_296274 [Didymella exigua CBS 183.55]KAF1924176.1 hypothetical protein M421DRAFT_296274 [Didymella exigua CBS 183.55]